LASIARTYDCSPPAISYILSRSRARATAAAAFTVPAVENSNAVALPQSGAAPSGAASEAGPAALAETASAPAEGNEALPPRAQDTARTESPPSRPPVPPAGASGNGVQSGEIRRTLHLSHGPANGPERNGEALPDHGSGVRSIARPPATPQPSSQPTRQSSAPVPVPGNGASDRAPTPRDPRPGSPREEPYKGAPLARPQGAADPPQPREGGAIDQALRERVYADTAAFLAAFDAALADDTPESRAGLREATDRLLRAGARTRIELERLEARLPLPARDKPMAMMPAWRQR